MTRSQEGPSCQAMQEGENAIAAAPECPPETGTPVTFLWGTSYGVLLFYGEHNKNFGEKGALLKVAIAL